MTDNDIATAKVAEENLPAVLEPYTGALALTPMQLRQLLAPLNQNRVAKRGQGARQLSYLEAWDVKAMLIRIFGFGGFSSDVIKTEILSIDEVVAFRDKKTGEPEKHPWGDNKMHKVVTAMVTLRLTLHASGATYTESAVASQKGPDIGEVADFAVKTAESDALKRAAINLGSQFGLGLYNNGSLADPVQRTLEPGQSATIEAARKADEDKKKQEAATTKETPNE